MRRSNGLLGLIGIILLVFAVAAWLLTPLLPSTTDFATIYIAVHAVAGILAIVAYLTTGLENLRSFVGERSTRYGTSTVLASLIFAAILVLMNFLAYRHHRRFDLSSEKVYSLSPQSVQVLNSLDKDLTMEAFVEGGTNPELDDLLRNYSTASSKVTYRLIDPDREPELTERYGVKAYNTIRIGYGDASNQVTQPTEENITNALIKLTRAGKQVVCVIEGHGEPDVDDKENPRGLAQAKVALENENYEVKKVLLASMDKVPDDCNIAMIAGPTRPFLAQELPALDAYLRKGGRMLALLSPDRAEELVPFFATWGVKVGDDVVVDQVVRLFQGPALGLAPLADTYEASHEITKGLKGRTLFPMTRSVSAAVDGKAGIKAVELVKTSPSSWAESDVEGIFQRQQASLDGNDRKGPVAIAVAVDADLKQMGVPDGKDARLAVFGSADFADNQNFEGTYFNRDLFLNTVGWLGGQVDLLSIRPRALRASRVSLTEREGTAIFYLSVLLLPELLLLIGLAVWWRRE